MTLQLKPKGIMGNHQMPMANLIMYQPHRNRRELHKMQRDRLPGRRRTTPAVQVHNLSQQSIGGGSRSRSRWRIQYRNRRRNRDAQVNNQGEHRDQRTLDGRNLAAKDSDSFGDEFPERPAPNSSIITFQNTGQMKQYLMSEKSEQIATAFKKATLVLHYMRNIRSIKSQRKYRSRKDSIKE